MWRNLSTRSNFRKLNFFPETNTSFNASHAAKPPKDAISVEWKRPTARPLIELGLPQRRQHRRDLSFPRNAAFSFNHASPQFGSTERGYASAAAEALASTSEEEVGEIQELIDEIQELIDEINKQINTRGPSVKKAPKMAGGMGLGKYNILRRRQIKLETRLGRRQRRSTRSFWWTCVSRNWRLICLTLSRCFLGGSSR